MIVVDSSALIAILRREDEVDRLIRVLAETDQIFLSALSLLETSMVLAGRMGSARAFAPLDALIAQAGIETVPLDAETAAAARAACLRYGRGRHAAALNLGDCAAYALARTRGLPLLFKGADFAVTDVGAVVY